MALGQSPSDFAPAAQRRLDPSKYTALGDFLDEINKPDNRESLVKTYGDQGITGFLKLTGATKAAGTNDEVQWWEETRLHPRQDASAHLSSAGTSTSISGKETFVSVFLPSL